MGLGPPVCERCRVLAYHEGKAHQKYDASYSWVCKYCGNTKPQWNAWDCGLTEEELEANKLFLDFVKGTQDAPTSRGPNST